MASRLTSRGKAPVSPPKWTVAGLTIYRKCDGGVQIMMVERDQELSLWQAIQHLDDKAEYLREQLADVTRARAALHRVATHAEVALVVIDPKPVIAEIDQCRNQREALKVLAGRQGGRVRVRDAAKLIVQSSLTRGKLPSVRATLLRYVKESPDWIEEGDGYFTLVKTSRSPGDSGDEERNELFGIGVVPGPAH